MGRVWPVECYKRSRADATRGIFPSDRDTRGRIGILGALEGRREGLWERWRLGSGSSR